MSSWLTPDVNIPQRNISREMDQIFAAQQKWADPWYQLEQKYGPLYARGELRKLGEQTLGFDEGGVHVPGTLELGRTASQFQREADLTDVERLGGRAIDAQLNANPWLRRSLNLMSENQTPSRILATLNMQAENDLASGGMLSPDADRDIRETSRSVWAEKGLGHTDQAAISELFNRENVRAGRVAGARKFAGDVEGLNQTMRDYLGRTTQIAGASLADPYAAILARTGGAGGGGASLTPMGPGERVFNPFNPYFQDYFSSNQNAAATEAVANAQAEAATRAAIASIAGGFISDIRAKEKIVEIGTIWIRRPVTGWHRVPHYEFEYRAGCVPKGLRAARYTGVMADDVEEIRPDAIVIDPHSGFKMVNYDLLGIEMKEAA